MLDAITQFIQNCIKWFFTTLMNILLGKNTTPKDTIEAVDMVVVAENQVLLIERGHDPFKGKWAFPGGRVDKTDKGVTETAYREMKEETNLGSDIPLEYMKTVANNHRDPRGFSKTSVFLAQLNKKPGGVKAGDDAVNFKWFGLNDLPEMAFDHREILDSLINDGKVKKD